MTIENCSTYNIPLLQEMKSSNKEPEPAELVDQIGYRYIYILSHTTCMYSHISVYNNCKRKTHLITVSQPPSPSGISADVIWRKQYE
jgi:hypothetical protein